MKAKKRAKGEGSLFQRPNGMWEAKFPHYDRKIRKKRRYSVYGRTQEEVIEKRRLKIEELNGLVGLNVNQVTVGQWIDEWIEKYQPDISETTRKNYRSIICTYIRPRIGNIPLLELEWEDVQFMYNDIEASGKIKKIEGADNRVSKQTVNIIETVLNRSLDEAVKKKLMQENVSRLATKAKGKEPTKRRALKDDEQNKLYEAIAGHPLQLLFELYLETGLRRGEGLGLTFDNIDWEKNSILISMSLSDGKGKPLLGGVKTKASERTIRLDPARMDQLRERYSKLILEQQRCSKDFNPDNLIFYNAIGNGYMPRQVLAEFKRICVEAELPEDVCIHSLRHTHGTVLRRNGTAIEIIQRRLGHARASITLDIYTHREDEDQVEAVEIFAKHREKLAKKLEQNQASKS